MSTFRFFLRLYISPTFHGLEFFFQKCNFHPLLIMHLNNLKKHRHRVPVWTMYHDLLTGLLLNYVFFNFLNAAIWCMFLARHQTTEHVVTCTPLVYLRDACPHTQTPDYRACSHVYPSGLSPGRLSSQTPDYRACSHVYPSGLSPGRLSSQTPDYRACSDVYPSGLSPGRLSSHTDTRLQSM